RCRTHQQKYAKQLGQKVVSHRRILDRRPLCSGAALSATLQSVRFATAANIALSRRIDLSRHSSLNAEETERAQVFLFDRAFTAQTSRGAQPAPPKLPNLSFVPTVSIGEICQRLVFDQG